MKKVISILLIIMITLGAFTAVPLTVSAEEDAPLVDVPSGYDLFEFGKLYKEDKIELVMNGSKATVTNDEKSGGVILSGKPAEIEKVSLSLKDEFDLGDYTAGRVVLNALREVRFPCDATVTIDNTEFFSVPAAQQKKAGVWTGDKNKCADISALKLSGKHTAEFSLKFKDGVADKKTNVMLKNLLFVAYSVPVVDVDIDESLGTIDAMNGDENHQTECYGDMTINIPEGYKAEYTDEKLTSQTYEMEYIRGRGNSTWGNSKKPYKVKLKKKASLLGMGDNKHWGLIANYYDYSLLRNKYTYWFGAKLNMEFTPKCAFVDVVMNGSYLGSYCLSELVRVDESRVNIDELNSSETSGEGLTGGYLLNCGEDSEASCFDVDCNGEKTHFSVETPDFDEVMVPEQLEYIKNYVQNIFDAAYSDNLCDKDGVRYSEYLDIDSMVDYFIIQGTSDNGDAFINGSTYLYKKRGGKLYWGPLWDFDYVAWAATDYINAESCDVFRYDTYPLFHELYAKDSEFKDKFDKRVKEIDDLLAQTAEDGGQIDVYAKDVYLSQYANHQIISSVYTDTSFDNPYAAEETIPQITYDSEIARFKNWLKNRTAAQNEKIGDFSKSKSVANFYVDDELYYTYEFDEWNDDELDIETPYAEGKEFLYWYTDTQDGEVKLEDYYPYDYVGEVNFYAKWKDSESELNKNTLSLKAGATYKLSVKNGKAQGWFSSNTSVAAVKNGKVTALKKGSAKIYSVLNDTLHLVCKVSVTTSPTLKVSGKKFSAKKTYKVTKGKKLTVKVTGKAASVANKYSSTNKKVAKVISKTNAKKITIKAYKKGKATLTLKVNGVAFKIKVKVK